MLLLANLLWVVQIFPTSITTHTHTPLRVASGAGYAATKGNRAQTVRRAAMWNIKHDPVSLAINVKWLCESVSEPPGERRTRLVREEGECEESRCAGRDRHGEGENTMQTFPGWAKGAACREGGHVWWVWGWHQNRRVMHTCTHLCPLAFLLHLALKQKMRLQIQALNTVQSQKNSTGYRGGL